MAANAAAVLESFPDITSVQSPDEHPAGVIVIIPACTEKALPARKMSATTNLRTSLIGTPRIRGP